MLTWYTKRCGGPRPIVTVRLRRLVRESVVTAIVEHIPVVDERSDVEARSQSSILHFRHLALACDQNNTLYFAKYTRRCSQQTPTGAPMDPLGDIHNLLTPQKNPAGAHGHFQSY